jgi:hypothetical protein
MWDGTKRPEGRELQREDDLARRRTSDEAEELRSAWKDYCEVIAELDDATAALEHLRTARAETRAGAADGSASAPSAGTPRLIAGVCRLAAQRNDALRLLVATRHASAPAVQREFWLEFSWIDQEYRAAVHRLAEFNRQRLARST